MSGIENINDDFKRALLETIPCSVFIIDNAGRIIYWNRSIQQLTGYTADEVLGSGCENLKLTICDEGSPATSICAHLPKDSEHQMECEIRRKDGSVVPVVRTSKPVRDSRGENIGAIEALSA
ncbi:PAS domain S-box protein [Anaerohalosphaera lusitana]|uniref:PAS domain S-box protein n=1 Tax=Anaerohalosphaera lusitana TaxID=1936003 RepID=A0A1U9NN58_9BACT|nr:PAS domain-containing protein [Anaerohalosphaera lusitana]AQT69168.1 PAS domain S-box protein [Anaerohalosphaera lusitana]